MTQRQIIMLCIFIVLWEHCVFWIAPLAGITYLFSILQATLRLNSQQESIFQLARFTALLVVSMCGGYAFLTFHRPGHFITALKEFQMKRVLRKLEVSWRWQRVNESKLHAWKLLPLVEELWVIEGRSDMRMLQAVCVFVDKCEVVGDHITFDQRRLSHLSEELEFKGQYLQLKVVDDFRSVVGA
jgi:hypothetical protein